MGFIISENAPQSWTRRESDADSPSQVVGSSRSSGVRANDTRTDRRLRRERRRISRRCWALWIYNEHVRGLPYMRVRGRSRQRGSTAVEFALVFPIFFTLIACALEGGRFV